MVGKTFSMQTDRFIIVSRTAHKSCYTAPFTVAHVQYYAPGCFTVQRVIGECRDNREATKLIAWAKRQRRHVS